MRLVGNVFRPVPTSHQPLHELVSIVLTILRIEADGSFNLHSGTNECRVFDISRYRRPEYLPSGIPVSLRILLEERVSLRNTCEELKALFT